MDRLSGSPQHQVFLLGLEPGGSKLAARVEHGGAYVHRSLQEYFDSTQKISSVVVVARHGDDLAPMASIYERALQARALVTTIVVAHDCDRDCCRPPQSSRFLAALRVNSDMLIATSGEDYVQFILDCLS
ncbi:MAG TPA: hypothetical protein VJQ52_24585 [Steroidobacteraceae bacterium]|nr:hypothetical protein [Steroidobacteraceae bacterium]